MGTQGMNPLRSRLAAEVARLRANGMVVESEVELSPAVERDANVLATLAQAANGMPAHKPGCPCRSVWCSALRTAAA